MNAILNLMQTVDDDALLALSEAIDVELERRLDWEDPIRESTRRRTGGRQCGYRHYKHRARANVPPAPMIDSGPPQRRRLAA